MLINSLNFPPVKQYGFYSEGFVYFVCILSEASLGFYCQDYKYFRNLDSLTAFYSYKTIASANYAANCPPFLPENEKPHQFTLSCSVYYLFHTIRVQIHSPLGTYRQYDNPLIAQVSLKKQLSTPRICPSNNLSSISHHCIKVIMVTIFLMLKLIITLISSVNYYNIKYYQNSFSLS